MQTINKLQINEKWNTTKFSGITELIVGSEAYKCFSIDPGYFCHPVKAIWCAKLLLWRERKQKNNGYEKKDEYYTLTAQYAMNTVIFPSVIVTTIRTTQETIYWWYAWWIGYTILWMIIIIKFVIKKFLLFFFLLWKLYPIGWPLLKILYYYPFDLEIYCFIIVAFNWWRKFRCRN